MTTREERINSLFERTSKAFDALPKKLRYRNEAWLHALGNWIFMSLRFGPQRESVSSEELDRTDAEITYLEEIIERLQRRKKSP